MFCAIVVCLQDITLAEAKEAIIGEIMEYHEVPKKQPSLEDKFDLKPVMDDRVRVKEGWSISDSCWMTRTRQAQIAFKKYRTKSCFLSCREEIGRK